MTNRAFGANLTLLALRPLLPSISLLTLNTLDSLLPLRTSITNVTFVSLRACVSGIPFLSPFPLSPNPFDWGGGF